VRLHRRNDRRIPGSDLPSHEHSIIGVNFLARPAFI
jgi:hypothetical protein